MDLRAKMNGLKQEVKTVFLECTKEIFDRFPECQTFSWTQYTPYFMDGDQCYFGVNEVNCINGDCVDDGEGGEWWDDCVEVVQALIDSFEYDELEYMFGEGEVVVSRDSVKVKEHDHD